MLHQPTVRLESTCSGCRHVASAHGQVGVNLQRVPPCCISPRSGWSQPAAGAAMLHQPTVRLESTCSGCRHVASAHGQVGVNLQRVPPCFPPELWNVHEATVSGAPLTNNQCDGWNNRFSHLVGYKHPSIWMLVEAIQMENQKVMTLIAQDLIGQPPRKRIRPQYVSLQTRLLTLCQDRVQHAKQSRSSSPASDTTFAGRPLTGTQIQS